METLADILDDDEIHINTWTPSIWMFLRRFVFVGLVTSIPIGFTTYSFGFAAWLAATALAIAVYGFVFDDYIIWLERRHDKWILTTRRLIYVEGTDFFNALSIPVTDIASIKQSFWGSVVIQLRNSQKISMSYLPNRKSALMDIESALVDASKPQEDIG